MEGTPTSEEESGEKESNVIPLNAHKLVYICACGCQSWIVQSNNVLLCAHCDKEGAVSAGEWVRRLPKPPQSIVKKTVGHNQNNVHSMGDLVSFQGMVASCDRFNTTAVIIVRNNGHATHWCREIPDYETQWVEGALKEIMQRILTKSRLSQSTDDG